MPVQRLPVRIVKITVALIALTSFVTPRAASAQGTPFQFRASIILFSGTSGSAEEPIPVPAGMRLVIETLTADLSAGNAVREPHAFIETVVDGAVVEHELALTRVTNGPTSDVWTATKAVRLYTSAENTGRGGATPKVVVRRGSGGANGTIFGKVTLSGHLVPDVGGS